MTGATAFFAQEQVMLVALTGVYLFLRQEAGAWGILGYTVAMAGNIISLF